jgi:hypothetical protein
MKSLGLFFCLLSIHIHVGCALHAMRYLPARMPGDQGALKASLADRVPSVIPNLERLSIMFVR